MSFREPLLLLALALLPLAIAAYVLAQRRRKKFALRYTNLEVLATVAGRSWGRHIPAAFALLALTALLIALGRPERTVAAPQRQGAVIMVTDTSGSMEATDVAPDAPGGGAGGGAGADQEAAGGVQPRARDVQQRRRVDRGADHRPQPDLRRDPGRSRCTARPRWATGSSSGCRARARRSATATARRGGCRPRIVLLSDGKSERGKEPVEIADQAKKLKVPIYTIALGTQPGVLDRNGRVGAGAARQRDAARRRRDDRRALLRRPERRAARGASTRTSARASRPRRSSRRSPRRSPAPRSRCCSRPACWRCCGWGGSREPSPRGRPRSSRPGAHARASRAPGRSRRPSCARSIWRCCGGSRASCPASTSRRRSAAAPSSR